MLARLDLVTASVHSKLRMNAGPMTDADGHRRRPTPGSTSSATAPGGSSTGSRGIAPAVGLRRPGRLRGLRRARDGRRDQQPPRALRPAGRARPPRPGDRLPVLDRLRRARARPARHEGLRLRAGGAARRAVGPHRHDLGCRPPARVGEPAADRRVGQALSRTAPSRSWRSVRTSTLEHPQQCSGLVVVGAQDAAREMLPADLPAPVADRLAQRELDGLLRGGAEARAARPGEAQATMATDRLVGDDVIGVCSLAGPGGIVERPLTEGRLDGPADRAQVDAEGPQRVGVVVVERMPCRAVVGVAEASEARDPLRLDPVPPEQQGDGPSPRASSLRRCIGMTSSAPRSRPVSCAPTTAARTSRLRRSNTATSGRACDGRSAW